MRIQNPTFLLPHDIPIYRKSWWRHFRFEEKVCNSRIKLLENANSKSGQAFRKKLLDFTRYSLHVKFVLTSFPVRRKPLITQVLCEIDEKLLHNVTRKSRSAFQKNQFLDYCRCFLQNRSSDDAISGLKKTLITRQRCLIDNSRIVRVGRKVTTEC